MNNSEATPVVMYAGDQPSVGIEKTVREIDQSEFTRMLKTFFEYRFAEPFNEVMVKSLIDSLRLSLSGDEHEDEVHIVFRNIPPGEALCNVMDRRMEIEKRHRKELEAFDEATGAVE